MRRITRELPGAVEARCAPEFSCEFGFLSHPDWVLPIAPSGSLRSNELRIEYLNRYIEIFNGFEAAAAAELSITNGRDDWIRTSDPHNPIVVRYQTAPRPVDQNPRRSFAERILWREFSDLQVALCRNSTIGMERKLGPPDNLVPHRTNSDLASRLRCDLCHADRPMSDAGTKVAVVGASGYTGQELLRVLVTHPFVELVSVTSRQEAGKLLEEVFPRLAGAKGAHGVRFVEPDVEGIVKSGATTAFLALPHGVASEYAVPLLEAGLKVIDLSADYRLRSPEVYEEFYGAPHPAPELLEQAVFGLPEFYRSEIKTAQLVASPGCYPTSILIPLVPLLKSGLVDSEGITVSSLSGVSGAGKKADPSLLFAEVNESLRAYGAPKHRHLSEIEQELSFAAGSTVVISFVPHLMPVTAGIATTIFCSFQGEASDISEKVAEVYETAYFRSPFVRVRGEGAFADTKHVVRTNFVDVGWVVDSRTGKLILSSAEDNLGKGAATQALQSFNLMHEYDETCGLLLF